MSLHRKTNILRILVAAAVTIGFSWPQTALSGKGPGGRAHFIFRTAAVAKQNSESQMTQTQELPVCPLRPPGNSQPFGLAQGAPPAVLPGVGLGGCGCEGRPSLLQPAPAVPKGSSLPSASSHF